MKWIDHKFSKITTLGHQNFSKSKLKCLSKVLPFSTLIMVLTIHTSSYALEAIPTDKVAKTYSVAAKLQTAPEIMVKDKVCIYYDSRCSIRIQIISATLTLLVTKIFYSDTI